MDARIILAGQPVDLVGAMRQGNAAAIETNALRQNNQLTDLYRQQGAGLLAGDQGAMNALAGVDPGLAMGFKSDQQAYAQNTRKMEILNANERRVIEDRAAEMTAAERAAAAAEIEDAVKMGMGIPDAATWDQMMAQVAPEMVGQFGNRQALAFKYMSVAEVMKATEGPDPMAALNLEQKRLEVDALRNPRPDPGAATDLRKEFSGLAPVKNFAVQSDAYAKVVSAAKDPSAAGDLALIFSFMKMLDPTSVVREQEFANAQNAAGIPERVRAMYNNVLTGERLTPSTRADFLSQTQAIYQGSEREYSNIESQYRGLAERQGIPVEDAMIDFRYSGEKYTPPVAMRDLSRAGIGTGEGRPTDVPAPPGGPIIIDGYTVEAIQ